MSDFDPPKSDDPPPREVRGQNEARLLEDNLRTYATKLGLKIWVVYDAYHCGFRIYGAVFSPNEYATIDEDALFVRQPPDSTALVDLLQTMLDGLQLKLHDNMTAAMSKTDVRERQFGLSKEDKHLLHDMFMDACNERLRDFPRAEPNHKKIDEYEKLMNRLYR